MVFSGSEIVLLALLSVVGITNARFEIVEPYPAPVYPVEFTSTQVTCIAYDASGVKVPERIQFMRKDQFNVYTNITAGDNIFFTNRTEDNGRKLFVTFHIRNVTEDDDSQRELGSYECHAFAVNDSAFVKRGFSINVIKRRYIPRVKTGSEVIVLKHGDEATIYCNITDMGNQANTLLRISWYKDGKLLKSGRRPDPAESDGILQPVIIKDAGGKDGGRYNCLLEVLWNKVKEYNVSAATLVNIEPWFENVEGEKEAVVGKSVTLECSAQGFPLNVEWKVKKDQDSVVKACVDSSTDKRYKISRKGEYDPYILSVSDLNLTDSGDYYCCLPSNCSVNVEDNCQRFTLTVTDTVSSDSTMPFASLGVILALVTFFLFRYHF